MRIHRGAGAATSDVESGERTLQNQLCQANPTRQKHGSSLQKHLPLIPDPSTSIWRRAMRRSKERIAARREIATSPVRTPCGWSVTSAGATVQTATEKTNRDRENWTVCRRCLVQGEPTRAVPAANLATVTCPSSQGQSPTGPSHWAENMARVGATAGVIYFCLSIDLLTR